MPSLFANGLLVGLGGFFGASARYWCGTVVDARTGEGFPWGTLAVNLLGSLLLGWLLHAGVVRGAVSLRWQLLMGTGFLGAYTTFSTFTWEMLRLTVTGHSGRAATYLGLSLALGLLAVWLGGVLDRALAGN